MATLKGYWRGTHRTCAPEETLDRIRPAISRAGITRVAELTWLDSVGIATFQAVRPNSRMLCVSMGKGVTPMLARVSAIMESLEWWVSENLERVDLTETIGEVRPSLPYDPITELDTCQPNLLTDLTVCDWVTGTQLTDGKTTYVPRAVLRLDTTLPSHPRTWKPPQFLATSNGLASGNTRMEAILHGILEIIERDSTQRLLQRPISSWNWIDPSSIDASSDAGTLVKSFHAAGNHLEIVDATSDLGIPCIYVRAWSPTYPLRIAGFGCHLDPQIALTRALTEAAQNRLNQISGMRDDIPFEVTNYLTQTSIFKPVAQDTVIPLADIKPAPIAEELEMDVSWIVDRVAKGRQCTPIAVDITPDEMEFSAVKVICPGLLYPLSNEF